MRAAEQTRARYPDADGFIERDGVRVHWERYGSSAPPAYLLLPTWEAVHSRTWKCQIPYLARYGTVDHVRPARERALGPAAEPSSLRSARVRRGRRGGARHGWGGPCGRRGVVRPRRVADPGGGTSRARGRPRRDRPGHPTRRHATGTGRVPLRRSTSHRRGLGQGEPPLLAARLGRIHGVLLRRVLQRAAFDKADRGRRRLVARDRPRDHAAELPRLERQGDRALGGDGTRRPDRVPGRCDPWNRGSACGGRPRPDGRRGAGLGSREPGRLGPRPARPRPCAHEPAPSERRARGGLQACRRAPLDARSQPAQASPLHLLAHRPRPRLARRRDRRRAPPASPRPRDRVAGAGSGDARPRGPRRAHPSSLRRPRERVAPHRLGVRRPRPARVPGDPADGRDPGRELHGLPRHRRGGAVRRLDRRRGLGDRLLPAREPGAEDGRLLLAHRLRRLAADAGRRRARGLSHGRSQRRDDRAHRPIPAHPRPGDLRREPRRHRARHVRARAPGDPGVDRGRATTSRAM